MLDCSVGEENRERKCCVQWIRADCPEVNAVQTTFYPRNIVTWMRIYLAAASLADLVIIESMNLIPYVRSLASLAN